MKNVLVTGGCGFIGSNFIRFLLETSSNLTVVNLDKLTYAGNLENLKGLERGRKYHFIKGDICDGSLVGRILKKYSIDTIVNFAAESHVDRSILGPEDFVRTNIYGTHVLLEAAKSYWGKIGFKGKKFLQVSTDEVYGSLGTKGKFREDTPLSPNSPYSSSKAGADLLARAYFETYGFPVIISRCSNNYGPYQFPEKFIPLMMVRALKNKSLPVYGDGRNVRDWLHVKDHCGAIRRILKNGKVGEIYNIGGCNEWRNIDVARLMLKKMGKSQKLIKFVKDRPGHDRRYAIDAGKLIKQLKWKPKFDFDSGLEETIDWYLTNKSWWMNVMTGEYKRHYKKWYSGKR
jgi:dTDP-glucose 4,6-dehydratase